jgi:SOS regulatory protein LexA
VTLIFGIANYTAVAEAYMAGLEALAAAGPSAKGGQRVDRIASVASFFVSRVDTAVDKELEKAGARDLLGKIGVDNCRLAYAEYRRLIATPRWQSLAKKGYIERDPARSRGVNLLGFGAALRTQPVPFYGRIHAGEPALLPEYRQGYITIDRRFVPADEVFFLKVKGDSMVGRCINDGDYVMVNPKQEPRDNDIVAARLGEDATVKTYTRKGSSVVLEAANPAERDITVQPGMDFGVLGVVCGVAARLRRESGERTHPHRPPCRRPRSPRSSPPSSCRGRFDRGAESRRRPGIRCRSRFGRRCDPASGSTFHAERKPS